MENRQVKIAVRTNSHSVIISNIVSTLLIYPIGFTLIIYCSIATSIIKGKWFDPDATFLTDESIG